MEKIRLVGQTVLFVKPPVETFFEIFLTSKRGTDFTHRTPPGGIWLGDRGTGWTKPLVHGSWQTVSWSGEGVMWPEETGNRVIYFGGKASNELLNRETFTTFTDATILIEQRGQEYNQIQPHSVLLYRPLIPRSDNTSDYADGTNLKGGIIDGDRSTRLKVGKLARSRL